MYIYIYIYIYICSTDSLRESSVKIGTIHRRLAWPLRKDDIHACSMTSHSISTSKVHPSEKAELGVTDCMSYHEFQTTPKSATTDYPDVPPSLMP